jgi:2-aminoethylphosphonate-pyruvate transaminase
MSSVIPKIGADTDQLFKVDRILNLFTARGDSMYGGELVTQSQHALQAAHLAASHGADSELITAALLHDVGHLITSLPEDCEDDGVDDQHEVIAAKWLSGLFGKRVTEPIRLHVPAKRYRCTIDPEYLDSLSFASKQSLKLQGGLMSPSELKEFEALPFCQDALRLRNWDDQAKDPLAITPDFEAFRRHVETALLPCSLPTSGNAITASIESSPIVKTVDQINEESANHYLLLTPGPLTTSRTVRQAMMREYSTWDVDYNAIVTSIRNQLVELATRNETDNKLGGESTYTSVLLPGSGTFCIESVLGSVIPPDGKILIVNNGAYGARMVAIAQRLGLDVLNMYQPETEQADVSRIADTLNQDAKITHVAMVHCETTTGLLNPVEEVGSVVNDLGRSYIVDAMSSFGGIPMTMQSTGAHYLVSSANKCIQGVPGFGFVIANRQMLNRTQGWARSLSLDLWDQWNEMEQNGGKWRYTSPTHVVNAFAQALKELNLEGGVNARHQRYVTNQHVLASGMRSLGFQILIDKDLQSPIITSFLYPDDKNFSFQVFYDMLKSRGFVIYPGKVSKAKCFRIGNIGHIFPDDMKSLIQHVGEVLNDMGITLNRVSHTTS